MKMNEGWNKLLIHMHWSTFIFFLLAFVLALLQGLLLSRVAWSSVESRAVLSHFSTLPCLTYVLPAQMLPSYSLLFCPAISTSVSLLVSSLSLLIRVLKGSYGIFFFSQRAKTSLYVLRAACSLIAATPTTSLDCLICGTKRTLYAKTPSQHLCFHYAYKRLLMMSMYIENMCSKFEKTIDCLFFFYCCQFKFPGHHSKQWVTNAFRMQKRSSLEIRLTYQPLNQFAHWTLLL